MATVNLGRIKPVFRGAYSGSTAYVVDDIVTHGNETFICIQAHGAGTQATSQTAYWTKLAAKGADGTDVGTTLTTQGDILYRDGSGLQRLAKGTANQTLQMNGGATAPSWVTVAPATSDFVRIANLNLTSGNKASFDNVFSTSDGYQSYKCIMHGFRPNANQWLKFRWRSGGSDLTNNYKWRVDAFRRNGSNNNAHEVYAYNGYTYGAVTFWSQRSDGMAIADIDFGNPAISSINGHTMKSTATTYEADNGIMYQHTMNVRENTAAYDGFCIEISNTSNAFTQLDISVYGIK
mgnify:CR=1 FL=1